MLEKAATKSISQILAASIILECLVFVILAFLSYYIGLSFNFF